MYGLPFVPWRVLMWGLMLYLVVTVAVLGVKDAYIINLTDHMARALALYPDGKDPHSGQDLTQILADQISQVVPVERVTITYGPWAPEPADVGMKELVIHVNQYDGSFVTTTVFYGSPLPIASQLFKAVGYEQKKPIIFPVQFSYYREW